MTSGGAESLIALSFGSEILSVVLWSVLILFLLGNLVWVVEMLIAAIPALGPERTSESKPSHELTNAQVRVLTIGAADVVQRTVDALPEDLLDRRVIAEEPMDIEDATVHVVPDSFDCEATKKGRALEWARRNVPCEKEYVLYLDEDTIVGELSEIPDADVVQFSERPVRTTSLITYLSELLRVGYQFEQRAFSKLPIPLYAWGGGIAIRKSLEDEITWNYETITEDTTFVWKAVQAGELDFETVPVKFYNQAPPSVSEMIKQRRRWFSGGRRSLSVLPVGHRLLFLVRSVAWSLTPLYPILVLLTFSTDSLLFDRYYFGLSILLTGFLYLWSLLGVAYTRDSVSMGVTLFVLTPLIAIVHSLGAFVGLIAPVSDFDATAKIEQTGFTTEDRPSTNER